MIAVIVTLEISLQSLILTKALMVYTTVTVMVNVEPQLGHLAEVVFMDAVVMAIPALTTMNEPLVRITKIHTMQREEKKAKLYKPVYEKLSSNSQLRLKSTQLTWNK